MNTKMKDNYVAPESISVELVSEGFICDNDITGIFREHFDYGIPEPLVLGCTGPGTYIHDITVTENNTVYIHDHGSRDHMGKLYNKNSDYSAGIGGDEAAGIGAGNGGSPHNSFVIADLWMVQYWNWDDSRYDTATAGYRVDAARSINVHIAPCSHPGYTAETCPYHVHD